MKVRLGHFRCQFCPIIISKSSKHKHQPEVLLVAHRVSSTHGSIRSDRVAVSFLSFPDEVQKFILQPFQYIVSSFAISLSPFIVKLTSGSSIIIIHIEAVHIMYNVFLPFSLQAMQLFTSRGKHHSQYSNFQINLSYRHMAYINTLHEILGHIIGRCTTRVPNQSYSH